MRPCYGAEQNQLFCYGEGNMRKFRIRNAESNMRNDSNPVENLGFNKYRSRTCKLTIQKNPKIQWRGWTLLTSPLGTAVLERGNERMGGSVGKDVSAGKKKK